MKSHLEEVLTFVTIRNKIIVRFPRSHFSILFGVIHFDYVVDWHDSPLNGWVIFSLEQRVVFPDRSFDIHPIIVSTTQKCEDLTYVEGKRIRSVRKASIGSCEISQCLQIAGPPFPFLTRYNIRIHCVMTIL